ncbi:16S rRNA (adenine(1518)-N(6)/adenine(1519)-N(6))-dimethyltransferase RsmA [Fructilactobacillus fructivorans]|uniref:Ribosomal RNA small subunit methyltransferase A n=1 Tax=Fructilactobacillus fructivorans TaxID=1614 RepID=A0A0C1PM86_9LACO|nr:16S rRNA (adenine(1518)-N(6)/adenine(1519)-N(6))-dimethyltransferase RsmA [Fructilactobacillus fructivorans]KID41056.1 Dimethyladenosine transferase [Fructilactobacillus fructivorans]MCT0151428.1 16S rRNA (adenine(1518)-N(6)/adenine(1519)-N(6))-dimethyltransferase RsmA [Fructilactobacillus fructivorans]MCT2866947.1 16S rRNA (adenine(1518)-N(6)/adenine(1519)-N(6))-dimethyltransferase RsmA [Fructilactobacillus fructivorans]MCT2869248.1 16S rRNA (adenine(1518)-N(6)/adenine(1519)-N(6))-dimethylt
MSKIPAIGSPARTQAILNRYRLNAKKSLGQNFLNDLGVLKEIVQVADISTADDVIEIGPGIGALTEQIAQSAHEVMAFEIDENLLPILDETLSPYDNIKVINQDFLQANLPKLIKENFDGQHRLKVVANLPYYVTKPILMDILKGNVNFDATVLMMQKEVAERISAKPGNRDYGALTVITQYLENVEIAINVSAQSFIPSPKVDSSVVKLTPKQKRNVVAYDEKAFFGFAHGCFMHRRKTLWNNLQGIFGKQPAVKVQIKADLKKLNINQSDRPEQLSVDQFVEMANQFHASGLLS